MSQEKKYGCSCSLSFFVLFLSALFVILKMTHAVDWSWWWIFSPLMIYGGIVAVLVFIVGALTILTENK